MKLKYYLRGIGIGIIITTIIFTIAQMIVSGRDKAVAVKEQETTQASVLAYTQKAQEEETTQALITQQETTQEETTKEETTQEETTQEETTEAKTQEQKTQAPTKAAIHLENNETQIEIGRGSTATQVADLFYEAGIIDDRDGFINYMVETGNSVKMITGTYIVKKGDSFENLAQIITTR